VIAPSLVSTRAGDRIKTDRRDAEKLARSYRSGDLTPVWVPDAKHEAIRDLVRAREAAKEDQLRARHRLGKYLLRYGIRAPEGWRAWTAAWWQWLRGVQLDHAEQNSTLIELILEVDHQAQRIERLDGAIDRAIKRCTGATARAGRCATSATRCGQSHGSHASDRIRHV
jgi:transposase